MKGKKGGMEKKVTLKERDTMSIIYKGKNSSNHRILSVSLLTESRVPSSRLKRGKREMVHQKDQ